MLTQTEQTWIKNSLQSIDDGLVDYEQAAKIFVVVSEMYMNASKRCRMKDIDKILPPWHNETQHKLTGINWGRFF